MLSNVSWGWRKLLQIRNIGRPHFWHQIGNGKKTMVWFDLWCQQCPIIDHLSIRSIIREGFNLLENVADVVHSGTWSWPIKWNTRFPILNHVTPPLLLDNKEDEVMWKTREGKFEKFAVRLVWDTIRPRRQEVPWVRVVYFATAIPRHAFNLWLVMCRKLKTQDRLKQ